MFYSAYQVTIKGRRTRGGLLLGLATYFNPFTLLITSFVTLSFYQGRMSKRVTFIFFVEVCSSIFLWIGISKLVVGDFSFIDRCYWKLFLLEMPTYSVGFMQEFAFSVSYTANLGHK